MSNLYTLRKRADEVAAHFGVATPGLAVPEQTVPQSRGLVVRQAGDRRLLQSMSWGFPHPTRQAGDGPKPVNLVANLTSPMWDKLVVDARYRCLIPLTHFAEPEGEPSRKTRTWFSVEDAPIAAWAGFCRDTSEWGPVFAGMTMTANAAVSALNERMPVLLSPQDYERWLTGTIADVIALQFSEGPASRIAVLRTSDRWRSGIVPDSVSQPQMTLAV